METVKEPIAAGANIEKECPLYSAAGVDSKTSPRAVKALLEAGAKVNAEWGEYGSPLWAAACFGSVDMFKMILGAGADVTIYTTSSGTALYAAAGYRARSGGAEIVKLLVDAGADVNAGGGFYGSPLGAAAYRGSKEMVEILLQAGANVNRLPTQGFYPQWALKAAWENGKTDVVEFLRASGARDNIDGKCYGPTLSYAARWNHIEMAKMLLDAGDNVHIPAQEYGNALCVAADKGHIEMFKTLVAANVGVNIEVKKYGQALYSAACGCRPKMSKVLLDYGADINIQVEAAYGIALCRAVNSSCMDAFELLLDAGNDVHIDRGAYGTALYAAASSKETRGREITEMLVDAGADVNTREGKYGTALYAAISKQNGKIVQMLVEAGADVNFRGGRHDSPSTLLLVMTRDGWLKYLSTLAPTSIWWERMVPLSTLRLERGF